VPGDRAAPPNGALIEVSPEELERLDRRELRYTRVEVGTQVGVAPEAPSFEQAYVYTAKPENLAPDGLTGAVVLRSYVSAVEAAFDALGPGALAAYSASTDPPAAEIVDARLIRDEIPPGNPREW
jgi:hypothetical protein